MVKAVIREPQGLRKFKGKQGKARGEEGSVFSELKFVYLGPQGLKQTKANHTKTRGEEGSVVRSVFVLSMAAGPQKN